MAYMPESGEEIQIFIPMHRHQFWLNHHALNVLLANEDIEDHSVCIVSVVGMCQTGRSFLLNFFLRYLYAKYASGVRYNWIGTGDEPLTGFHWHKSSSQNTVGIVMWSDIFTYDYGNGDKVAIILLDTQGAPDNRSTECGFAKVFALSTLLSSVQVYNLSQNIEEHDLSHLKPLTEYGRFMMAQTGVKPFQRLEFLVRDWCYPYETPFGEEGGFQLLQRHFSAGTTPEQRALRQDIVSCFYELGCFLLPHPGPFVAYGEQFNGQVQQIPVTFIENLITFVPLLLAPENLVRKQINGQHLCVRDLIYYFHSYSASYQGDHLPSPMRVFMATAEANQLAAMKAATDHYRDTMNNAYDCTGTELEPNHLHAQHLAAKQKALYYFSIVPKVGGIDYTVRFGRQLDEQLDRMYVKYTKWNAKQGEFKGTRTVSVYLTLAVSGYIASTVCSLCNFPTLARTFDCVWILDMGALIFWLSSKCITHSLNAAWLENFAGVIWRTALSRIFHSAGQHFGFDELITRTFGTQAMNIPSGYYIDEYPLVSRSFTDEGGTFSNSA